MAIHFDALDLVRSKNKAKRHEAIKQQQREQKEKNIRYFMDQLSEIKRDHDLCQDPSVKKLLLDKCLGVAKLFVKKIDE
ncbi:hypothetical protein HTVC100P_gp07 [Pelagibacter phage HTVC100P]|nr:hypothetical protein HTVC100P_gp07 [Pelagibacter phage HTVC100P]